MVQPSFIFPKANTPTLITTNTTTLITITTTNSSSSSSISSNGDDGGVLTPESAEDLKAGSDYLLGVGLCLFAAATCAVSNVLNVRINQSNERVTTAHLLLMSGVFSVLLALGSTVFLPNQCGPLSLVEECRGSAS